MGLYDQITSEAEETREHWGLEFQTKDLDSLMEDYVISHEGLFKVTEMGQGWKKKDIAKQKIDYTGLIKFYTHDEDDKWVEYWALLDFGKVLWIKRME